MGAKSGRLPRKAGDLTSLPQVRMNMSLHDPPTVAVVEQDIAALSDGKAPGSDHFLMPSQRKSTRLVAQG